MRIILLTTVAMLALCGVDVRGGPLLDSLDTFDENSMELSPDQGVYNRDEGVDDSDEVVYNSDEVVYSSDEVVYKSDEGMYSSEEEVYIIDEGVYNCDESVYDSDEVVYNSDEVVYNSDEILYSNDKEVYNSDEGELRQPLMAEALERKGQRGISGQNIVVQQDNPHGGRATRSRFSNTRPRDSAEKEDEIRAKRSVHYVDHLTWGYNIPYVIDDAYSSQGNGYYVPIVRRAFKWFNERTCVTFHDETDNFGPDVTMTQLGYESDIYLSIINSSSCFAVRGMDSKNDTNTALVSPCFDFDTMRHEIGHTLGVMHVHQNPARDKYMVVNYDNIHPNWSRSFSKQKYEDIYTEYVDLNSIMLYPAQSRFGINALETYFLMRDDLLFDTDSSSEEIFLKELSKIYRCNEVFCNNSTTDCGPGYYTFRNGSCRCVCPRFYDSATNCQTLIDKPSPVSWPDVPLVIFKAGKNTPCPDGLQPGGFSHDGLRLDLQGELPDLYNTSGTNTYFETCSKNGSNPVDWEVMPPGGAYCLIKPVGVQCGFGQAATLKFTSKSTVESYGNIGDITISGANITMRLCCSSQANKDLAIDLPNKDAFRLIAKESCPIVKGMRSYRAIVDFYTRDKSVSGGVLPQHYIFPAELQTFHCYYQPPVYGCHREVTLNTNNRQITLQTPGYSSSAREPNRRCFYIFHAPEGAQLILTFLDYDLDKDDKMLIQRSNLWEEPVIVDKNYPYQIVSEANHLVAEFWAGYKEVSNKGIRFTVKVLLAEEACYDVAQNGADYLGEKSITELYERCIPWAEAANCDDFPWGIDILPDLGGASCRNPDGNLLGPWCYTYVNDTVCQRRYCDVCNNRTPFDVLTTSKCRELMAADPDFCNSALQRFGCFLTCGFLPQTYNKATCGTPTIPSDGKPKERLKSSYKEGEKVVITCNNGNRNASSEEIVCRKDGWTRLNYVCDGHGCIDKIRNCDAVLSEYPDFCLDPDSIETAEKYCYRSCGMCKENNRCSTPLSYAYSRTSSEATVNPGDVMTFKCNPGRIHVGGDLRRACSASGKLLGQAPVCHLSPVAADVNRDSLRPRLNTLSRNYAFLLDQDGYRVPFDGKVTKWYYYCYSTGDVYALVYRKDGSNYTYVGSNIISCQAKWPWSHNVLTVDQISVKEGDIVGFFTIHADTLYVSACIGAKNELLIARRESASDFNALMSADFDSTGCLIPSFGFQVKPVKKKPCYVIDLAN